MALCCLDVKLTMHRVNSSVSAKQHVRDIFANVVVSARILRHTFVMLCALE